MIITFREFVLSESLNMSRVREHTKQREVGILSAHRAEPDHHPDWERIKNLPEKHRTHEIHRINNEATDNLEKDIKSHGFGYKKVNGRYIENFGDKDKEQQPVDEKSFMVFGKKKGDDSGELKDFLTKHGEKYHQESVAHKAHNQKRARLIGTKPDGVWPKYGKREEIGNFYPNRIGMFHTILHGGSQGKPETQSKKVIIQKGTGKQLHRLAPSKKVFTFNRKVNTRPA